MTLEFSNEEYLKDSQLRKKYFFIYISGERYLSTLAKYNRSEQTIRTYRTSIRALIPAIGELKGKDCRLSDLEEADFFAIARKLTGSESTVRYKMWVLKEWIEFDTGSNPFSKVKLLWNRNEPKRTFIDREQFDMVYKCAGNDAERLVMMLGSQMGLRMAEIIGIRLNDIQNGELTIRGKGHNGGKVVRKSIPTNLQIQIREYIEGERAKVSDGRTDMLLLSSRCRRKGSALTSHSIRDLYERVSKESGIHVTSHVMRRLYCTMLADDAGLRSDLDTLRRMMRHEDVSTTVRCYLDANTQRIAEAEGVIDSIFSKCRAWTI